jgi:hypothetical protein
MLLHPAAAVDDTAKEYSAKVKMTSLKPKEKIAAVDATTLPKDAAEETILPRDAAEEITVLKTRNLHAAAIPGAAHNVSEEAPSEVKVEAVKDCNDNPAGEEVKEKNVFFSGGVTLVKVFPFVILREIIVNQNQNPTLRVYFWARESNEFQMVCIIIYW